MGSAEQWNASLLKQISLQDIDDNQFTKKFKHIYLEQYIHITGRGHKCLEARPSHVHTSIEYYWLVWFGYSDLEIKDLNHARVTAKKSSGMWNICPISDNFNVHRMRVN